MAFNRTILVGNLVADPELKTTPSGVSVTRFRIAVNRRFVRAGEQPQTDFFDIVAWRTTAEFVCKHFAKGKPILVSGTLQNHNWTDNNDVKHYSIEIVADEVTFVERKDAQSVQTEQTSTSAYGDTNGYENLSDDEEIPF